MGCELQKGLLLVGLDEDIIRASLYHWCETWKKVHSESAVGEKKNMSTGEKSVSCSGQTLGN